MKKILVILGHPDKHTFCGALEEAYIKGAKKNKLEIKHLELGNLKFDPILWKGYKKIQKLEPDLHKAQEYIKWADHIVLIYPVWWGFLPALLKGFIDRAILPGFAFRYRKNKNTPEKYLKGKTAHIIMTMDTPLYFLRLGLGLLNRIILNYAILGFTGISIKTNTIIGSVVKSSAKKRNQWLRQVNLMGKKMI